MEWGAFEVLAETLIAYLLVSRLLRLAWVPFGRKLRSLNRADE